MPPKIEGAVRAESANSPQRDQQQPPVATAPKRHHAWYLQTATNSQQWPLVRGQFELYYDV